MIVASQVAPQGRGRSQADLYQAMNQEERRREELRRRRERAGKTLLARPAQRLSWDVDGASPAGPAVADVSVILAVRTAEQGILIGELRIPADRWDMAAFIKFCDRQA